MSSKRGGGEIRDYSAKGITSEGFAVCLFPEQPPPPEKKIPAVVAPVRYPEPKEEIFERDEGDKVEARRKPHQPDELWMRDRWRNRLVYLVAFIAFTLSLNNAYLFPVNVYRYGAQFFIPYTIFTVFIGYPVHLLQASLGQYYQSGILDIWDCAPLMRCVGWAMLVVCAIVSLYYNLLAAYALTYFSRCFNYLLPWKYCTDQKQHMDHCLPGLCDNSTDRTSPARHFFWANVLNARDNFPAIDGDLAELKWWLVIAVFFAWLCVFAATLRNARSVGKASIFILFLVYFALVTLLIVAFQERGQRTITFNGYWELTLFDFGVWCMAALQVVLELGLSFGVPVVYGSFCHFQNVVHIDSFLICTMNYVNSLLFFLLFYYAGGALACESNSYSMDILGNSFGAVYIIYSGVFAVPNGRHYWCMLFSLMLFCIVLSTQIGIFFVFVTAIYDAFPTVSQYRFWMNLVLACLFAILGMVFCTANGIFPINLFHTLTIFMTALPIVFLFVLGIVLVYSVRKYRVNMRSMVNATIFHVSFALFAVALILLGVLMMATFFVLGPDIVGGRKDSYATYTGAWILLAFIVAFFVIALIWWLLKAATKNRPVAEPSPDWTSYEEHVTGQAEEHSVPFTQYWRREERE